MLHIGFDGAFKSTREGTLENALSSARFFGIKPKSAQNTIDSVLSVVSRHENYYRAAGMDSSEIAAVMPWLSPQVAYSK